MRHYATLLLPLLFAAVGLVWSLALLPEKRPMLHEAGEQGGGAMSGYMADRPDTLPMEGARAEPPYDPEKPPAEIRQRGHQRQGAQPAPDDAAPEPRDTRGRPERFGSEEPSPDHPRYGDPEDPPSDWRGPHSPEGPLPEERRGPERPQTPGEVIEEALEPLVPPEP